MRVSLSAASVYLFIRFLFPSFFFNTQTFVVDEGFNLHSTSQENGGGGSVKQKSGSKKCIKINKIKIICACQGCGLDDI